MKLRGQEVRVGLEQHGRRGPSALLLHPEKIRSPAEVDAGEGVTETGLGL